MNVRPLFKHRFAAPEAGALDCETLCALVGELCAARGTVLDATPVVDAQLAWSTDATAAETLRRPILLRTDDVERAARRLLVFTAYVEPSLDALRTHAERFGGGVPLCAAAGYATRCAPPPAPPAKRKSVSASRARVAGAADVHLTDAERAVRSQLVAALENGDALFDRAYASEPVALRMLARSLADDDDDDTDERAAWERVVVATRSFRLLLLARGYVRRRAARRAATADATAYVLPADQLTCDAHESDSESASESAEPMLGDDDDNGAADAWIDATEPPRPEAAPARPPHELDALDALPLDALCRYECERAARDRLSVLLSVCAHHECAEHAARLPNAAHVLRYPHGPGAPVASTFADAPGALASATNEQYAALGCALLAAAVAGSPALERWLLYAEALRALHRAPQAIDAQLTRHVAGVRAAVERARPRGGAADGARDLIDELRILVRDTANLEFGAAAPL